MTSKRSRKTTLEKLKKFSNSYTFAKVMSSNPDLCKRVIERLLGIEIQDLEIVTPEADIPRVDERGVRCDVLASNQGGYFEVEMQTYSERALGRRIHYLDSMIETLSTEKGQVYLEIPNRVIIFICTYDPFEKDLSLYPFKLICERDSEIVLETGSTILIVNASTCEEGLSKDLENFLQYVQNGTIESSDGLLNDLNQAVAKAIRDESWVSLVNRIDMEKRVAEIYAAQKAHEEGLEEGIDIGRIQEINDLVSEGLLTSEQGAQRIERLKSETLALSND